ncbi:MAG: FAD-dependent oxidoreductase, partial [Acetobacteraceae bacterium]|nr:FAD-dependent oxidoreductase [Acetobacteraceae bacterium]
MPQTEQYDVAVAGGGSAGVAAAIAAARMGARTLLLEAGPCLGGASTLRGVVTYCGLHTLDENPRLVVRGVAEEVLAGLARLGGLGPVMRHRGVFVPFEPEPVKLVLDRLCAEAGVELRLHAFVAAAERDGAGRLASLTVAGHGGLRRIAARAFVDATGEADLAAFAGAATRYGNGGAVNLGTLATRFGGIAAETTVTAEDLAAAVAAARARGEGPFTKDRSVIVRLPISGDLVCYVASAEDDPRDPAALTRAETASRRQAWAYLDAIKTIPGCEGAYLAQTGHGFGTRESRHIDSARQLRWDDIASRQRFTDCIALGAWGAEWHSRQDYASDFDVPPERGPYEIPLSCLRSADTPNLFAAGRTADGDRKAGAAIRVMGTAFATGQAAGVAAAEMARAGSADSEAVRAELRRQGAV